MSCPKRPLDVFFKKIRSSAGHTRCPQNSRIFLKALSRFWDNPNANYIISHLSPRTMAQTAKIVIPARNMAWSHWESTECRNSNMVRKLCGQARPEDFTFEQIFQGKTFSTFSAGSKGGGDFPDDGSRRVSHLFEVPEKMADMKRMM